MVAALDEQGNVLWSWHIWCTDVPNTKTVTTLSASVEGYKIGFMDRNLGATAETGDGCVGMSYQWGRKDPFPGTSTFPWITNADLYLADGTRVSSIPTIDGPGINIVYNKPETGNIAYTIRHPGHIITLGGSNSSLGWFWEEKGYFYQLWGYNSFPVDLTDSRDMTVKTMYDPCPAGYHVPSCQSYSFISTTVRTGYMEDQTGNCTNRQEFTDYGKYFYCEQGRGDTIYFPASGYLSGSSRQPYEVGFSAYYYTSQPYHVMSFYASSYYYYRQVGAGLPAPVRCAKDDN